MTADQRRNSPAGRVLAKMALAVIATIGASSCRTAPQGSLDEEPEYLFLEIDGRPLVLNERTGVVYRVVIRNGRLETWEEAGTLPRERPLEVVLIEDKSQGRSNTYLFDEGRGIWYAVRFEGDILDIREAAVVGEKR